MYLFYLFFPINWGKTTLPEICRKYSCISIHILMSPKMFLFHFFQTCHWFFNSVPSPARLKVLWDPRKALTLAAVKPLLFNCHSLCGQIKQMKACQANSSYICVTLHLESPLSLGVGFLLACALFHQGQNWMFRKDNVPCCKCLFLKHNSFLFFLFRNIQW